MGSNDDTHSIRTPATYAALTTDLSQGDIVYGIPPVILDDPLTICRPDNKPGRCHSAPAAEATGPEAFTKGKETVHATAGRKPGLAMVIWEDCQIDKMRNQGKSAEKWFVGVAPIFPVDDMGGTDEGRRALREGRRLAFFPLPAMPSAGLAVEHYVDFRFILPVKYSMLGDRIIGLSLSARQALQAHFFKFMTAKTFPSEMKCPNCGELIPHEQLLLDLHE